MYQSDSTPTRVFSGNAYQISRQDHGSELLVISFAERKEPKPAEFFATKFLDKEKISYLAGALAFERLVFRRRNVGRSTFLEKTDR